MTVWAKPFGNPPKVPSAGPRDNTSHPTLAAICFVLRTQARSRKPGCPDLPVVAAPVTEQQRAATFVGNANPDVVRVVAFPQNM